MKRHAWLFLFSLGVFAPEAFASNGTAATAAVVRPDGSAVTENFTTAGASTAWFAVPLTAGHSYVAEVEAPFNGAGSLSGGASPTLGLTVYRNDGTTPVVATSISSCAPATGASGNRLTFAPTTTDAAAGAIKILVVNLVAPDYSFRFASTRPAFPAPAGLSTATSPSWTCRTPPTAPSTRA
jgi:hypothetical protein